MKVDSYAPGTPSWIDIGVNDTDAAARFYGGLFGWDVAPAPPETGGYRMAMLRGEPVAGVGPQMNPGPPAWATYFSVEDVHATASKVTELGGQILMPPMDILDVGKMAVCMDPTGAAFSLWQPLAHAGSGLKSEPGSFCWNELISTDTDAANAFYTALFGWTSHNSPGGPPGGYTEFHQNGQPFGGMLAKNEMMPPEMPSVWSVYFAVEDCDASVAKAIELGGSQIMEPQDIEPGRFAIVSDDQGAIFQVIALNPNYAG